jgi:hypothetical protein
MKRTLPLFGLALLFASVSWSKSSYLTEFNSQYGTTGTKLDACVTCHVTTKNLNAYGGELERAMNANNSDTAASLQSIEPDDADGDGASNINEIVAGTFPGDASDFPALPVEGESWTRVKGLYR